MDSDTGRCSALRSDALKDLVYSGSALDASVATRGDAFGGSAWVRRLVVHEVDVDAVAVMFSDDWGDGRNRLVDFAP